MRSRMNMWKFLATVGCIMMPFTVYAEPKNQGDTKMTERITQTAGRTQLGEFSPMFAHLNDDVLFWIFIANQTRHRQILCD